MILLKEKNRSSITDITAMIAEISTIEDLYFSFKSMRFLDITEP